jgi:hypothetical protein
LPGVVSSRSVTRAKKIVRAHLKGGDSSLKRLHEEARKARLEWVAFEEVKLRLGLRTIRRGDGRLAWKEAERER